MGRTTRLSAMLATAVVVASGWATPALAKKKEKGAADGGSVVTRTHLTVGEIEVGGRVFFRLDGFREQGDTILAPDLASARIQVGYRWQKWLRAVGEAELSGKIKDAYVRLRSGHVGARAGQFKPPESAIELESSWVLPMATRGLIHDLFNDRMQVGGRRPGAQAEWSGPGSHKPKAFVGAFAPSGGDGELLPDPHAEQIDVAGRASLRLGKVEVGLFGESLENEPAPVSSRYWAAGADATLDHAWCGQGVRAWADVTAGSHRFTDSGDHVRFVATRLIGAWRRGGVREGEAYVEPYGSFELMDPDLDTKDDLLGELVAGVNAGAWRRLRATIEVGVRRVQRNTPGALDPSFGVAGALPELADRTTVRLFVGAAF